MLLLPPRSLVSDIPSCARQLQSNSYFNHLFSCSFLMTGELTEVLTFLQDNGVGESRYSKKINLLHFWMEDYIVSFTVRLQHRQKIDNTLDSNILQLEAQTLKIQLWKNGLSSIKLDKLWICQAHSCVWYLLKFIYEHWEFLS